MKSAWRIQRQEDHSKFETRLGYIEELVSKNKTDEMKQVARL